MKNNEPDILYYKECSICHREFVYAEPAIYKDDITRDIIKCPFCDAMLTADRVDITEMLSKDI